MRAGIVLCVMFAGLVLLAPFGSMGIAPWVFLAALLAMPQSYYWSWPPEVAWCLYGLVLWAGISMNWGRFDVPPLESYAAFEKLQILKLVLLMMAATALITSLAMLTDRWRRWLRVTLVTSTVLIALILGLEALSGAEFYRVLTTKIGEDYDLAWRIRNVGQGGYVLLLLFWPVAVLLYRWEQKKWLIGLVLGTGLCALSFDRSAQIMAILASGVVFAATLWRSKVMTLLVPALMAISIVGMPTLMSALLGSLPQESLPTSWLQRVVMWQFTVDQIFQNALWGYGLDASRTFEKVVSVRGVEMTQIQLHPHNAALQIWLELGAIGSVLASFTILALTPLLQPLSRLDRAMVLASLTSFFVIANFSFGLWQEWWIMTITVGVLAVLLAREPKTTV